MTDIVDKETRSRMMSGIRGKNTKPEILIRHALHSMGYRYRLHVKGLPGKPDLVFPKYHVIIFIHGCFWHGHNCPLFKWPSSNVEFWRDKIKCNKEADSRSRNQLIQMGWRVMEVWECAIRGPRKRVFSELISDIGNWINDPECTEDQIAGA